MLPEHGAQSNEPFIEGWHLILKVVQENMLKAVVQLKDGGSFLKCTAHELF